MSHSAMSKPLMAFIVTPMRPYDIVDRQQMSQFRSMSPNQCTAFASNRLAAQMAPLGDPINMG